VNFSIVPEGRYQEVIGFMVTTPANAHELLERASRGDPAARHQLLIRHRDRLRRMVALRLDRRLAPRLDPSDIVQESLAEAHLHLSDYLLRRPLPFYPWLRQFALERVAKQYERHVRAQRRSVTREASPPLPEESVAQLARRLIASATSPSRRLLREEVRDRVRTALADLKPSDREVLVLRYLEGLSNSETAAVLGMSESAVGMRHLRALDRLRVVLGDDAGEAEQ
jgi:RNA polymerase sigma-70 factor (ECF subfamily)